MRFKPHEYQTYAIRRIEDQPACGLFLEMGLGKTVITLTAISDLIALGEVRKVLVVAPLRVAQSVWAQEARKWDHTNHLQIVRVLGNAAERRAALACHADVYVINRENVAWLVDEVGRGWDFDMIVLDELSSFKSRASQRWKAMRKVRSKTKRIVGLTGTPAPNGLIDLWAQIYLLDGGDALEYTLGGCRERYFRPGRCHGATVYEWVPRRGAEEAIYKRLEGLCVSMKSVDHIRMPERVDNAITVPLNAKARHVYEEMQRDALVELQGETITAVNAAAVTNKLLQLAQGAVYDESGNWHTIHDAKLDALEDIVEAANGKPVLVYYAFRSDLERLKCCFPDAVELRNDDDVERWNDHQIPMLIAHPDSAGHGLNLQNGGSIMVWFGLTWSLEKYQQANARLYRQGQKEAVVIHHLVAQGTVDERIMRVLAGKASLQDELMEAVRAVC